MRAGVLIVEGEQSYLDVEAVADNTDAHLAAAVVRYRIAVGPLAGQRTMRLRGFVMATEIGRSLKVSTVFQQCLTNVQASSAGRVD